jgi:hypothetical protein
MEEGVVADVAAVVVDSDDVEDQTVLRETEERIAGVEQQPEMDM